MLLTFRIGNRLPPVNRFTYADPAFKKDSGDRGSNYLPAIPDARAIIDLFVSRFRSLMIPAKVKAAFFDVDGVLLDSLPEHLQMCRDKAAEFGLNLKMPSIDEFRNAVSRGLKVSPMQDFFVAVGFPEPFAIRGTRTTCENLPLDIIHMPSKVSKRCSASFDQTVWNWV